MEAQQVDVAGNLDRVRQRIAAAAARAGRSPDEIVLLAVSKNQPLNLVRQAIAAGQRDFGENLVEEAWQKFVDPGSAASLTGALPAALLPDPGVRLHLIGPIQSRKAPRAVACRPALIHAVDRLKIAERLNRFAGEAGLALDVLLEVNISGEASKFGFSPDGLWQAVDSLLTLPHLRVAGLMTIPPENPDPENARPYFAALRRLRDRLAERYPSVAWRHLSMGMSHDFEAAIAEGATIVRVGTAIFGPRP